MEQEEVVEKVIIPKKVDTSNKKVRFADKCILRLAQSIDEELIKSGRSTYKTQDKKKGYVITTSKMYVQGAREKYWFAYRKSQAQDIQDCDEQYIVYGCKDESTLVLLPIKEIEDKIEHLNASQDDDGNISHWHIVFFKDATGNMTWMLSRPEIQEIDITEYVL